MYTLLYYPLKVQELKQYQDKTWLEEMYWGKGLTLKEVAQLAGVCLSVIYDNMIKLGVKRRTGSVAARKRWGSGPLCLSKEFLYQKYWVEELSLDKIAQLVGSRSATILTWMKKFGIPTRTAKEAGNMPKQRKALSNLIKQAMKRPDVDKKIRRGENHPCWKGGITYKDAEFIDMIKERDKCTCQICGRMFLSEKQKDRINLHHIDFNHYNNDPFNVIVLCTACHLHKVHMKNNKLFWQRRLMEYQKVRGI